LSQAPKNQFFHQINNWYEDVTVTINIDVPITIQEVSIII